MANMSFDSTAYFYRTVGGAEVDLVIEHPGGEIWTFEIKRGKAPSVSKGFQIAISDLDSRHNFVVYSGLERYPLAKNIDAISVKSAAEMLRASFKE